MDSARRVGVLWRRWTEIVGDDVAAHAQPSSLRRGVLRIRADSPGWANEIKYLADEIRRRANEVAGAEVVTEVRLWVGPGERAGAPDTGGAPAPAPAPRKRPDDPLEAVARARLSWLRRRRSGGAL